MFGLDPTVLAFILLAGLSAGGVAYAFLFTRMSNERQVGKRLESIRSSDAERNAAKMARERLTENAKRRKTLQDSLKDLDEKQKLRDSNTKKAPLRIQLKQAGMSISIRRFWVYSILMAFFLTFVALILGAPWWLAPGVLLAATFGLPRWFVTFRKKRRVKAFLAEFPNALDVIVRAVKSGLPLNDGIRVIAGESPEPVKSEFRRIVEQQQLGMSIPDASMRMQESMPCPEAGFFGIVIQIQAQAGGNLSEALGNLSRVLRERKKMKAKVQALSMEAKASAWIIGLLPAIVAFLVYLTSPNYITPLFTTSTGNVILGASAIWMGIGVAIMKKMISFEV